MSVAELVLVVAGTLSGLTAGLLFAFSVSVLPGLRLMDAKQHIIAMQRINVAIQNPVFGLAFAGPVFLLPLSAYLYRDDAAFGYLVAASVLHILGVIVVTAAGNIPPNNRLDAVDAAALSEAEAEEIRTGYHGVMSAWMVWHHIRTVASTLATALVIVAALA